MTPASQLLFRRTMRWRDDEERILPLINVVFLLLIFFMVAGRIAAGDRLPVQPPVSQSNSQPAQRDLTVLVAADGRVALDGEEITVQALGAMVARRVESKPGIAVRIKADRAADAAAVVRILGIVQSAGVARAQLLTKAGG
jgi:biopolymer transport protein ExbD